MAGKVIIVNNSYTVPFLAFAALRKRTLLKSRVEHVSVLSNLQLLLCCAAFGESVTTSPVLSNVLPEYGWSLYALMWLGHASLLQNLETWIPVIT